MAQVYINNWLLLRLRMQGPGGDIIYTMSYRNESGSVPNGLSLQQLAEAWWNAMSASLRACHATNIRFVDVTIRDLSNVNGQQGVYTIPANTFGTVTGESVPSNVALCMSLRTAFVGRSGRGRTFFGGMSEAQTAADNITSSAVVLYTNVAAALQAFAGVGAFVVDQVVASRVGLVLRDVENWIITNVIDSQRRRLTGRGN